MRRVVGDGGEAERALEEVAASFPPELRCRGFARNYAEYRLRLRLLAPLLPQVYRVLDVGAGAGATSLMLRRLGARVVVLDTWAEYAPELQNQMGSWPEMRERFRRFGVPGVVHDVLEGALPFGDGSFDLVTLYDVIEHLPASPRRLFWEVRRVLRPGGHVALSTPNVANLRARVRLALGRTVHGPMADWFEGERYFGHVREYTLGEVKYMLERSGFRVVGTRYTNAPQWNTRRRDGTWGRRLLPTSGFQIAKLLYFLVTGMVPSLRYGMHVLAVRE